MLTVRWLAVIIIIVLLTWLMAEKQSSYGTFPRFVSTCDNPTTNDSAVRLSVASSRKGNRATVRYEASKMEHNYSARDLLLGPAVVAWCVTCLLRKCSVALGLSANVRKLEVIQ